MDNIRVKLTNPYLVNYGGDSVASETKIITFPLKPVSFSSGFLAEEVANQGSAYAVKLENGRYVGLYMSFLLSQIVDISPDYLKQKVDQVADGEISQGMGKVYDDTIKKLDPNDPKANLNRYNLSLAKSAADLNEALGRGVDLDIDYTYQLSWPDEMSTNAINSPKFVLNVNGKDTTTITTPNGEYPSINNWAGTSYTAFWCAGLTGWDPQGQSGFEEAKEAVEAAGEEIKKCHAAQREAKQQQDAVNEKRAAMERKLAEKLAKSGLS